MRSCFGLVAPWLLAVGMMALSSSAQGQEQDDTASAPPQETTTERAEPEEASESAPTESVPPSAEAKHVVVPLSEPSPVAEPLTPAPTQTNQLAAENDPTAVYQLSLEELLGIKVTVASKAPQTVDEAPSVVTVFTRDDIRRLGVRTVEQLLNFVPGFQSNPDESDHFLRIDVRGRNTPAAESMLLLVDGQRVNDLLFGGIIALDHGIPTENIEQIEIIRGPGSALYGANAFLGVISIKTNRSHNDVTVGAGNMNRRYVAINAAKNYGELSLSSFAKLYTDEGYSYDSVSDPMGQTATAHDPVSALDSNAAIEYRGMYLRGRYLRRNFDQMNCCASFGRFSTKYETSQATVQAGYKVPVTQTIDLDTHLGFQRDSFTTVWPLGPTQSGSLSMSGLLWNAWSLSPNADVQWRLLSRTWLHLTLMAGGTYAHNRVAHISSLTNVDMTTGQNLGDLYERPNPMYGDTERAARRNIAAGYLQAELDLWSRLTLTVGGRYDWYTDFGKSINPRAALVWATPWKSHLKLAYGKAFRAPTLFEVGGSQAGIKPETVQTIEVSYVQHLLGVLQLTTDVFYQRLDNLIYPDMTGHFVNAGQFTTKGIEIELRTRAFFGARLMGSYTHLIRQSDDPGTTPRDFGAAALNYVLGRFQINLNSTIHGLANQRMDSNFNFTGAPPVFTRRGTYVLCNAHLRVDLLKGLRGFGVVENILNASNHPAGLNTIYLGRGRTFLFGISADL